MNIINRLERRIAWMRIAKQRIARSEFIHRTGKLSRQYSKLSQETEQIAFMQEHFGMDWREIHALREGIIAYPPAAWPDKMLEDVMAKIKINFEDPRKTEVIIRKVVRGADGKNAGIFGLGKNGKWLPKPFGGPYPDECKLPIMIYDNFSEEGKILA